jgi:hypothetical protein
MIHNPNNNAIRVYEQGQISFIMIHDPCIIRIRTIMVQTDAHKYNETGLHTQLTPTCFGQLQKSTRKNSFDIHPTLTLELRAVQ